MTTLRGWFDDGGYEVRDKGVKHCMKVIVFGAGEYGRRFCQFEGDRHTIVAVADSNVEKHNKVMYGHQIIDPCRIPDYNFDKIVICVDDMTESGRSAVVEMLEMLEGLGISQDQILMNKLRYLPTDPRVAYVRAFASNAYSEGYCGNIAECGVFRGHFSGYINEFFQDRKLYLFDTFSGFDCRDISLEESKDMKDWFASDGDEYLRHGSEECAILRCVHRENVVIVKGYIPDSFAGLDNERFLFVNLDMDVYAPTLEALRFFVPRMTENGAILLHDYYWWHTVGIKQAVDEFSHEYSFARIPIGDNMSVLLMNFKIR